MTKVEFQKLEEDILRRLKAIVPSSVAIDQSAIPVILDNYLGSFGLDPRPIIWAKDGLDAMRRAARSNLVTIKDQLDRFDYAGRVPVERDAASWVASRETAKGAGRGEQLDLVKGLMQGHSVLLSIPWRRYQGNLTGDRGARTNPAYSSTWENVHDASEYAARAAAECAWMRAGSDRQMHAGFETGLLPFVAAYEAGLWLFWITDCKIIALSRPSLQLQAKQLHCEDGPAVCWPEGEDNYFYLNGVHVPRELVETPARELDPRTLLRERNAQVRREIVRKVGIERVCDALEARSLDQAGDYELLLLDLQDGRTRPFLKMKNPSLGVYHIEGVAPECQTVAEALAWRNQSDVPPSVLT
jgi:hypothetical protein